MSAGKRFNIRVYGIWIRGGKVLVNEEHIRGQQVIKFPGGGMDWGEGTLDCLRREWKEELNLEIEILDHFYTTDYFQHSAFDDSQVVSIYYLVSSHIPPEGLVNSEANERTYWMPLSEVSANTFTLSIDQKVGAMLKILHDTSAL
ncbi:MAG: hypothetical protein K0R82_997 [Flavipsychrobacter sp.]|jgi:ADP-ribose pyrophosphatase YjhB (NUDIX family)|nr:hypothetical protein [Flavipsychrobacter sp.]